MSESFDFLGARAIVPGAFGEPGQRTFFVQARTELGDVSFKVEKQQVAALCEYFENLLEDLPGVGPVDAGALETAAFPTGLEWTIGGLGVAFDEDEQRLVLVAEELVFAEDESTEEPEPATARFHLDPAQIAAFVAVGNELVEAGRPACRLCGRPVDSDGHACPRLN